MWCDNYVVWNKDRPPQALEDGSDVNLFARKATGNWCSSGLLLGKWNMRSRNVTR